MQSVRYFITTLSPLSPIQEGHISYQPSLLLSTQRSLDMGYFATCDNWFAYGTVLFPRYFCRKYSIYQSNWRRTGWGMRMIVQMI